MKNNIPLYHFFYLLKNHKDFELGLEEYFSLIEVLQKDQVYYSNAQKLLNLCRLLWLKPGQSENLFVNLFKQSIGSIEDIEIMDKSNQHSKEDSVQENERNSTQNKIDDIESEEEKEHENAKGDESEDIYEDTEDLFVNIINKKSGTSISTTTEESLIEPYKIHLFDDYVLLKERQLKQRWRSLKKIIDGNESNEIDIRANIEHISNKGIIATPIFKRKKNNKAELITMLDCQGSMVAFKGLAETLAKSAEKGAGINNKLLYFRDLPELNDEETDFYIYIYPSLTKYTTLITELKKYLFKQKDIAILIISDGGAARGKLNLDRISETVALLQVLKHFSFKLVWLNPVPKDRWKGTSADVIKDYVPMFEATSEGLGEAIKILRGKIIPTSKVPY